MTWQAISASIRGTSHIRADIPCQDASGYRVLDRETVIAAVADGLGSASESEEGARRAVETVLDSLARELASTSPLNSDDWIKILTEAFTVTRQALDAVAQTKGLPLRDFGTTLVTAAVSPDWIAVGHIGDGAIVIRFTDGTLETISPPQRGEYANEVTPLTAPNALKLVHFSARQATISAVALLTDGLQNLSINSATNQPYSPFFTPFFNAIVQDIDTEETSRQLENFLNSERVSVRTDDDKTLLILGRALSPTKLQSLVSEFS